MKTPSKQFTAWSYSRYHDYLTCPAQARYKYLDKLPQPANPAMARGSAVHELAAQYLRAELRQVPTALKPFAGRAKQLRAMRRKRPDDVVVEDTWATTSTWQATTWDDWDGCWLRVKVDVAYLDGTTLRVLDWKTGQLRPARQAEYLEQLELYAVAGLSVLPQVERVAPQLVYLDAETTYPDDPDLLTVTRSQLPKLQRAWTKRVKGLLSDTTFEPRPGNHCRYCSFRKVIGGPCQY